MTHTIEVLRDTSERSRDAAARIWALATAHRDGDPDPAPTSAARALIDAVIDSSASTMLAAVDSDTDQVLGFAAIEIQDGESAELKYLGVDPAAWGRGVAGRLLEGIRLELPRDGVREVCLSVYQDNETAVRAYERAGWVRVGSPRPHPKTGKPEVVYSLRLAATWVVE